MEIKENYELQNKTDKVFFSELTHQNTTSVSLKKKLSCRCEINLN